MKRTMEKVALAAFVCISLIFVVICVLTYLNIIPISGGPVFEIDWALTVILLVLAAMWVLLAFYLLISTFSQRSLLKYVMLYSDCHSSTRATSRVIKRLAVRESKQLVGVRIKKVNISSNEHLGLNMKIFLEVSNDDVAFSIDTLRYLLTEKYREVLGLEFAAMDFQVQKIKSQYRADLGKAQAQAKKLSDRRKKCTTASCHIEHSEDEVGEVSGNLAVASIDNDGENVFVTDDRPTEESSNDKPKKNSNDEVSKPQKEAVKQEDEPHISQKDSEFGEYKEPVEETQSEQKTSDNEQDLTQDEPQVTLADEETKNRITEQNRRARELAESEKTRVKPIYGTPESPLTEDIVVEIDDETGEVKEEVVEEKTVDKKPKRGKRK